MNFAGLSKSEITVTKADEEGALLCIGPLLAREGTDEISAMY